MAKEKYVLLKIDRKVSYCSSVKLRASGLLRWDPSYSVAMQVNVTAFDVCMLVVCNI